MNTKDRDVPPIDPRMMELLTHPDPSNDLSTLHRAFFVQELIQEELKYPDDALLVQAFAAVDRGKFAPEDQQHLAYHNSIVPLKDGSTISQPSLVAGMMRELELDGSGRCFEVGTASGYGAALLGQCVEEVVTVEHDANLAAKATDKLNDLGYSNISVVTGDGLNETKNHGLFDKIIVTAAVRYVPPSLLDCLAEGGSLVVPVGPTPDSQILMVAKKVDAIPRIYPARVYKNRGVEFVPLISNASGGWKLEELERLNKAKLQFFDKSGQDINDLRKRVGRSHHIDPSRPEVLDFILKTFPFPPHVYDEALDPLS
jgi:protein-L-isoaspartate(D-aspartate) O-methyltransferase